MIMVRSVRPMLIGLCSFVLALNLSTVQAQSQSPEKDASKKPKAESDARSERTRLYALPGEDPPEPFVPLHPRTVEDRKKVEAITTFAAARALEEHRRYSAAADRMEEAYKLDPDSVTILRRLARLNLILGRTDKGMAYGRRALTADPTDADTITRLITYYNNRLRDPMAAETLLKEVLANPKLGPNEPSRTLVEFELGRLYSGKLQQFDKAADSFAKVTEALDDKQAKRLNPYVLKIILGDDEADAYEEFGLVFLQAKRYEQAVKAFERGLDYDPDSPQLPLILCQTLLKLNQGEKALALVERYLKRQPHGVEGYELLAKVLTALKREDEITPRLEQAAKVDSKNLALQYALADRYLDVGQVERAEALYKQLLQAQPSTQGYAALASSLYKRKKGEELFKVILEAVGRPGGFDAVKEQIQGIGSDEKLADQVLDAGYKMAKEDPATLGRNGLQILAKIGRDANKREKLISLQRLELERSPSPQSYKEYFSLLFEMKKFDDAALACEEMFKRFPEERNGRTLLELGLTFRLAEKPERAIEVYREALKLDATDIEAKFQLAIALSQAGKLDESIALLKEAAKSSPANAAKITSALGSILSQAGRNQEAIAVYKELLERYPNDEDIFRTAHSNLSIVYVNMGDYAKGEAELEILLARTPDEPGVNNDLGYLYADQGKNLEKAETMIRKAVEQEPENFAYLDSLGWVLFKRGKVKEAVEPLEKAIKVQIDTMATDATVYEHLGDVYFQLQQIEKAREAWKSAEKVAAKATPVDKRLPEIRKKLESLEKLRSLPTPSSGNTP
jgi:tetratricopeptide (TPR) repeat protein